MSIIRVLLILIVTIFIHIFLFEQFYFQFIIFDGVNRSYGEGSPPPKYVYKPSRIIRVKICKNFVTKFYNNLKNIDLILERFLIYYDHN